MARSYIETGLRAHREGRLQEALAAYREALARSPDDVDALNLLGTALLQLGEAESAVRHLERASRGRRNDPHVLANLAQAYSALGRHEEACAAYRKAGRLDPHEAQFPLGAAVALARQGRMGEAHALLERLSVRFPENSLVWFNLANVMRDRGRPHEAIDNYAKARELDPGFIDARNNLGSVLHSLRRFAEAEAHYRACLALDPEYQAARYNLASALIDLGRFAQAEAVCREIVAREPQAAQAHSFLAAALGHQGRLLEALESAREAARLAPSDAQLAGSYGAALMETGHTNEGLSVLSHALSLSPGSVTPRQLLGTALLASGQFPEGWREYVHRAPAIRLREKYREIALTWSLPEGLRGKHACLLREQGLGDEIFFLRYAPLLAARGARVTYRAGGKLAGLLSRVACLSAVVEETSPVPAADAYLLVGDLPHALGEAASAPARGGPGGALLPRSLVLAPLAERVERVRARLASLGPPPYVGVTWRAGTAPEEQDAGNWILYKTVALPVFAAAMSGIEATFLALQRQPAGGEIEAFSAALGRAVHDFTALNEDLEDMAALLALIDEYVGVSNTNMHLRAGVGRTARVLVPAPAEWRWMQSGRASPWFPGFSIYRQSLHGDWREAFAELERDLKAAFGRAGAPGAK